MPAGATRDAQDARRFREQLRIVAVQLLVGHAVHDGHEALDARRALLLLALHPRSMTGTFSCMHIISYGYHVTGVGS